MKKFTSYKKVEISGFGTIWDDFFWEMGSIGISFHPCTGWFSKGNRWMKYSYVNV